MLKTLTAPLLALVLAVTPMAATPAQANSNDLGKVIAGATLLFIIGSALSNAQTSNTTQVQVVRWKVLPRDCRDYVSYRNNPLEVVGLHCLNRANFSYTNRLPNSCQRTVRAFGRNRTVFSLPCLRQNGWTI